MEWIKDVVERHWMHTDKCVETGVRYADRGEKCICGIEDLCDELAASTTETLLGEVRFPEQIDTPGLENESRYASATNATWRKIRSLCLASRPAPGAPGGQDALLERAFKAIDTLMATLTDKQAGGLRGKDVVETADAIRNYSAPPAPPGSPRQRAVAGTSVVCEACGCRWKRHADGWLQLYDAEQKPCAKCDNAPNPPLRAETIEDSESVAASGERLARDVLSSIAVYASDTLSGRVDGPEDVNWLRDGVRVLRDRARSGIEMIDRLASRPAPPAGTSVDVEGIVAWLKERSATPGADMDDVEKTIRWKLAQFVKPAPPAAPAIDESAWLIEGPGPLFWTAQVERGCVPWTTHTKAVRFARREDAECVRRAMGLTFAKVTEHVWISADAARACDPNPAPAIDVEAVVREVLAHTENADYRSQAVIEAALRTALARAQENTEGKGGA